MLDSSTPTLGFAAFSGVGKTTLLVELLPLLKARGLRVGVIKHSHHNVEVDKPGKDSYRHRQAGATPVMLVSPQRRILIEEFAEQAEPDFPSQLAAFPIDQVDLLLIEGFRDQPFAKIELHRPTLGKPLLFPGDPHIIAIASDSIIDTPAHLTLLDLNCPSAIADFILNDFLTKNRD